MQNSHNPTVLSTPHEMEHEEVKPYTHVSESGVSEKVEHFHKKKLNSKKARLLLVGLFFILLAVGSASVLYLVQTSQDLRQQASGPYPSPVPKQCNGQCTTNADCTTGYCHQIARRVGVCRNYSCANDSDCICAVVCEGLASCPTSLSLKPINSCDAACEGARCNLNSQPHCATLDGGVEILGVGTECNKDGSGKGVLVYKYSGSMEQKQFVVTACISAIGKNDCSAGNNTITTQSTSYELAIPTGKQAEVSVAVEVVGLGIRSSSQTEKMKCSY